MYYYKRRESETPGTGLGGHRIAQVGQVAVTVRFLNGRLSFLVERRSETEYQRCGEKFTRRLSNLGPL